MATSLARWCAHSARTKILKPNALVPSAHGIVVLSQVCKTPLTKLVSIVDLKRERISQTNQKGFLCTWHDWSIFNASSQTSPPFSKVLFISSMTTFSSIVISLGNTNLQEKGIFTASFPTPPPYRQSTNTKSNSVSVCSFYIIIYSCFFIYHHLISFWL